METKKGKFIKELRESIGMTKEQFAFYLKIPLRTVYAWEAGERAPSEYVFNLIETKIKYDKLVEKIKEFL